MSRITNRVFSALFRLLPSNNAHVAALCQRYIDRYQGDNNDNMCSNGELSFLQQVLPSSRIIFDVGANQGDWTALALGINAKVVVHCFEPSKATFQKLFARAFPQNVIINPVGLSSVAADRLLYVFDEGSRNNSLYQRRGLETGWGLKSPEVTESIQLVTLDQYCEQNKVAQIDLMKLDVEGHELEVLHGAENMLQRGAVRLIQFEYGGTNIDSAVLLKDFFEFLQPFGYKFYKIFPQTLKHIANYDQRLENFRYQNWVASLEKLT